MKMKLTIAGFLLVVLGLNSPQAFRLVGRTGTPAVAAGDTNALDKTSLVAWYDFTADGLDAHTSSFDLSTNSATHVTNGATIYVQGTSGSPGTGYFEAAGGFADFWMTNDVDSALIMRWRARTGISNGQWPIQGKSTRFGIRYMTASPGLWSSMAAITDRAAPLGATNIWYTCIANYYAGGTNELFVGYSTTAPASDGVSTGSFSTAAGNTAYFPGDNSGPHIDVDIDYAAFYSRAITADEMTWIWNSGGTRTYAELAD